MIAPPPRLSTVRRLVVGSRLAFAVLREPKYIAALPHWWRTRLDPPSDREPWWPAGVMQYVAAHLHPGSNVLEYGGGGSTHWLANQVATVTTVEHDAVWHARIVENLPDNATVLLREPESGGKIRSAVEQGTFDSYVAAIDTYPDQHFDLVIVDGRARVDCGLRAAPKVKTGGMLLLDDSQRRRYATLLKSLHGWKRIDFRGLKSKEVLISQTTVWHKQPPDGSAPFSAGRGGGIFHGVQYIC